MSSAIAAVSEADDSDAQARDAAGEACASARDERRMQMLDRLAEAGLRIALAIERRVEAAEPAEPVAELNAAALAYARVSRAVRLTLMLQSKLIEDLKAADKAGAEGRAAAKVEAEEIDRRSDPVYRMKARIENIVGRVAEARHRDDEAAVDRLMRESGERLDDEDLYGDLMERPVSELVARLCRDLGLDPDWAELAEELWAVREVESGQAGWPLQSLAAARPRPSVQSERELLKRSLAQLEAAERAFHSDTG